MVASLCLLSGLLVPAQVVFPAPGDRPPPAQATRPASPGFSEWLLTPRLIPGQEIVYRGTFNEQTGGGPVQVQRSYRLETRAFVLEASPLQVELAVLTLLRDQAIAGAKPTDRVTLKPSEDGARSARLERVRIDLQGRLASDPGVSLSVPLEGPPTLECGFCVAVPSGRVGLNRPWTIAEPGRPETTWRVLGSEIVGGTSCLRLQGIQQSPDWEKGQQDRLAWKRTDLVWVSPRTGIAQRVERRIEHRLPGREDPSQVCRLNYELQSTMQLPISLADDRRRELFQSLQLMQNARPLLNQPTRSVLQIDVQLARLKAMYDAHAETPYREALVSLRQRLEATRRGEAPPALLEPRTFEPQQAGLTIGKAAPDFVAADLLNLGKTSRLRQWQGRPVVLVFFNPASRSLDELMRLVQGLAARHRDITPIGLSVTADSALLTRLATAGGWKMPVLSGSGLRNSYGLEATPRLVFLDADGVVQGIVEGWGSETMSEVQAVLSRWLPRK